MQFITNILAWLGKNKTLLIAAILTGGEAIVSAGLPLPGSDIIPEPLRASAIAMLVALALYFRAKAAAIPTAGTDPSTTTTGEAKCLTSR